MQHEMWKLLCISLSMAVGNVNLVAMGIATRNEEGVVNAVVFAGCSSSKASANKLFQWEMQHELWRVLCKVLYLCV